MGIHVLMPLVLLAAAGFASGQTPTPANSRTPRAGQKAGATAVAVRAGDSRSLAPGASAQSANWALSVQAVQAISVRWQKDAPGLSLPITWALASKFIGQDPPTYLLVKIRLLQKNRGAALPQYPGPLLKSSLGFTLPLEAVGFAPPRSPGHIAEAMLIGGYGPTSAIIEQEFDESKSDRWLVFRNPIISCRLTLSGVADVPPVAFSYSGIEVPPSEIPAPEADGNSSDPAISGDGSVVIFASESRNLVPLPATQVVSNSQLPAFLYSHDVKTGQTTLLRANDSSPVIGWKPSISDDGRLVCYHTSDVKTHDTLIMLLDRSSGVAVQAFVAQWDGHQTVASVSPDGGRVAMVHRALFAVYDIATKKVTTIHANDSDRSAKVPAFSDAGRYPLRWSRDGRFVAFATLSTGYPYYVIYDFLKGTYEDLSRNEWGYPQFLSMSGDGLHALAVFGKDSSSPKSLRLVNRTDGTDREQVGPAGPLSPDATCFLSVGNEALYEQTVATGERKTILAMAREIGDLAFSADSRYVAFVARGKGPEKLRPLILDHSNVFVFDRSLGKLTRVSKGMPQL